MLTTSNNNKNHITIIMSVTKVFLGVLFIAVSTRVKIPWYPVPFTMQTFAVMLLGLSLGNTMKEAFGISISYVIAGCLGLPVFANSPLGFLYLMSPTGGYLIGFVITIPLISYIHNRLNIGLGKSLLVGVLSIFIPGVIVMSYHFGLKVAIMSGVVPFIIPEIMKISMISLIYKTSTKMGKF